MNGGGFTYDALGGGYLYNASAGGGGVQLADSPNWTGSHVWDQEDAGTTTVPTPVTLQHRNNAAGTPAAGYGIGMLFKLDSAARTLRSAGEIDAVWTDPTNAAEASAIALKAMVAGTLTEVARIGDAVTPQVDLATTLGRCLINSRFADQVTISHQDQSASTAYALLHNASGATVVNCTSGQTLTLRHAGAIRFTANTTGIGLYGATPVAQQTVTGSRGGATVAVLADLLTKLAALGAIIDGTTA